MKIHVEKHGHGEKILFIHGSGWNTRMWHNQSDRLMSSMEVILVDLPGHGQSAGEGCESVEEYMDSVYSVIKEHNLKKCYLAGHSLGGAITLSLALSYPDVLKGIILIGTGARLRVLPQILEGITRNKTETVSNIVNLAFSKNASSELKKYDFNEIMKCNAEITYKDFNACDHFNIMDSINLLKVSSLIICGNDDLLTPIKYSEYLHKSIKDSKIILIEDAGHMVMMEKPEEVNKAIEDFIVRQK